jgi:hypothetical protein
MDALVWLRSQLETGDNDLLLCRSSVPRLRLPARSSSSSDDVTAGFRTVVDVVLGHPTPQTRHLDSKVLGNRGGRLSPLPSHPHRSLPKTPADTQQASSLLSRRAVRPTQGVHQAGEAQPTNPYERLRHKPRIRCSDDRQVHT